MRYSVWEKRINEWQCELENDSLDKDQKWALTSMSKLTRMAIDSDQDYIPSTGYVECSRVIRLKKPIPNYIFTVLNMEKVVLSGVYIKVEGILFSKDYVDNNLRVGKNRYDTHLGTDFPEYRVSTIQDIGNGCFFMMKRGTIADYLEYGKNYEVFKLSGSEF